MNRHNYEEFFLMYVDNELNMHQRIEVELFIEQNPDLAAELDALREAVLLPEPAITFEHKNSLYKQEKEALTQECCEEQFLLYIDNELTEEGRRKVEAFVQQYPEQQVQLALLQQTVLASDPVVFANKKVLYRKERERRIIPFAWSRLAVAAALLGVTATAGWWFLNREEKGGQDVAVVTGPPAQSGTRSNSTPDNTVTAKNLTKAQQPEQTTLAPENRAAENPPQRSNAATSVTGEKYIAAASARSSAAAKNTASVVPDAQNTVRTTPAELAPLPAGSDAGIAYQAPAQTIITASIAPVKTDIPPATNAPQTAASVDIINNTHKTIAYKELDTSEDDQSLYVGSLELNRNKVKGILKKAGRMLGARAKAVTEENL